MNKTILIIIIVLVVLVGGYYLFRGAYYAPSPTPPTSREETPPITEEGTTPVKEITVSAREYSFNPPNIILSAGERVKLTFKNEGITVHNFVVKDLGVSTRTIGPGQTDTIEFTAPASGKYTFICSIPGHAAAGMIGDLEVE